MNRLFNLIVSKLEKIHRDKLYHYIAGLIIGALFTITFGMPLTAFVIVFVAALMKEIFDKARGSEPDIVDALWTMGGGLTILVMSLPSIII